MPDKLPPGANLVTLILVLATLALAFVALRAEKSKSKKPTIILAVLAIGCVVACGIYNWLEVVQAARDAVYTVPPDSP